jgi:hypothetical protein
LLVRRIAGATLACFLSGCHASSPASDDGGEPCRTGFLGSDAAAPDFDFQVLLADGTVAALADGATVPILEPPQGGRVIFVGVHATNVDGCALQLTGALRDLSTQEATVDGRTVNLVPTGDGWGVSGLTGAAVSSDFANFANIPVCPNEWSPTNIYGTVYGLEMTIQDREGRELTKKIVVTPQCGEPATLAVCLCICKGGYVLGESCSDGGSEQ